MVDYTGSGGGTAGDGGATANTVALTVTNVVIHYVINSIPSNMAAPITPDVGLVNVITEIRGGTVAVPESWATNYPTFVATYGSDFSAALTKLTGKRDGNGNALMVWQDFVCGTDPTDADDVFRASVTIVDGSPVVSFTPELSAEEAERRVYTTYGKVHLQDAEWTIVPEGRAADYNFFKVTVEMK